MTTRRTPPTGPFAAFLRAHGRIVRRLDAEMTAAHQLTLSQFEVLLHLHRAPDRRLRMTTLAEGLPLTHGGVTQIVDRLERRDLLRRVADAEDGRVRWAELTEAGQRCLDEALVTHRQGVQRHFLQPLDADERRTLETILTRLLEASADDDPPR
jgi:DNA-binding MarR family transcriptional regulator